MVWRHVRHTVIHVFGLFRGRELVFDAAIHVLGLFRGREIG